MKLFKKMKDGGPDSPVDAFVLIEWKKYFSIMLLRFNHGHRDAYHSHAFNAYTWLLKGVMVEHVSNEDGSIDKIPYVRSLTPKYTPRDLMHRVFAHTTSWALTIRGPWYEKWLEYNPDTNTTTCFTNGRKVVWISSGDAREGWEE